MDFAEFRRGMDAWYRDVAREATSLKDPYYRLERLRFLYRQFDSDERRMADRVLSEWVLSEDEGTRFDALHFIEELKIVTAVPAMNELLSQLASSKHPGAPFEIERVSRIIATLG